MDAAPVAPQLAVQDAVLSYGDLSVLRGLTLVVRAGERIAVMGRSGCGKTTLLRSICGIVRLQRGTVTLGSQRIIEGPTLLFEEWEIRRHMMYVAQVPTLLPHRTALENICLGLRLVRGLTRPDAVQTAEAAGNDLGLDASRLRRYPEELSSGEAQRVQLLRAMVLEPDILLLDEVTANIDPETTSDVVDALWLLRDRARRPQSIIIVTHLLGFAERFVDRIAFMANGIILEHGEAASFRSVAKEDATKKFLTSRLVR